MLHGSETLSLRKENEVVLQQAQMRISRCGIKLQNRVPSKRLRESGIKWHNFSTTAKQVDGMVMCCKKKTMIR